MADLQAAVAAHAARFNEAVRSGDWSAFVATFTEDAIMRFVGVPAGPYEGRNVIGAAYASRPPDDTMTVRAVEELDLQTARVRFKWDRGGGGTMTVQWHDGMVAELTVAFD